MVRFVFFPILFCSLLCTGCSTTGNPTQGGLFSWSSQKAQVLVDQQAAQQTVGKKRYNSESGTHRTLAENEQSFEKSIGSLKAEIASINEEVAKLSPSLEREKKKRDEQKEEADMLLERSKKAEKEAERINAPQLGKAAKKIREQLQNNLGKPVPEAFIE